MAHQGEHWPQHESARDLQLRMIGYCTAVWLESHLCHQHTVQRFGLSRICVTMSKKTTEVMPRCEVVSELRKWVNAYDPNSLLWISKALAFSPNRSPNRSPNCSLSLPLPGDGWLLIGKAGQGRHGNSPAGFRSGIVCNVDAHVDGSRDKQSFTSDHPVGSKMEFNSSCILFKGLYESIRGKAAACFRMAAPA